MGKASGKADNTGATPKRKAGGKPFQKGDKRINRAGAPKRGESWGEIINRVFSMTGAEIADYTMPLVKQLRTIGDTVTLKEAVILRVGVALMNEPTPGLFNAVMDRVEGTPKQTVQIDDKRIDDELAGAVEELVAAREAKRAREGARTDSGRTDTATPAVESAPQPDCAD